MSVKVTFNPPDELIEALRELGDRADDTVIPMTEIAKLFAEEMKSNIHAARGADGSAWAPLKESTLKRHDAILGIDSGETIGSIGIFVREHIVGAEATGKGGVFMHLGRGRDWRRGFKSKKTRGTGSRRRALRKTAREAFGETISGTEMDVREFAYVDEATEEKAESILLDYLFVKFTTE